MKIISISTDRKIFDTKSPVFLRMSKYAEKLTEMHVIVFTKRGFKAFSSGNLYVYPTNSLNRFSYVFDAEKICEKIIQDNKFSVSDSVITTQDPFETGMVGYWINKRHFLPVQVQVHTDFLSQHFKSSFLNRIRVFVGSFIIQRVQGVRVVSDTIKDSIYKKFPHLKAEVDVLPVFVDAEFIRGYEPKRNLEKDFSKFKFIIFMASRLVKEKRIDVAIKALKRVVSEFPHAGLVVAGSGPEQGKLEKLTRKIGLRDHVEFIGWQDDLISCFKTSDLYLLTSEYEGYGITLVEAGLSRCPIVTTKVGLAKTSLFKNNANSLVCPVGDVACLSDSILNLIHDNAKREVLKREMFSDLSYLSLNIDEYANRYTELLAKVLKYNKKV